MIDPELQKFMKSQRVELITLRTDINGMIESRLKKIDDLETRLAKENLSAPSEVVDSSVLFNGKKYDPKEEYGDNE